MNRRRSEIALGAAFFWILALMFVPVPAIALDLMLSLSLTVCFLILLLALYIERPLDFSVFPSLLLMVTLLRLGLNIASTRLILLHGAEGPHAAGNVIHSFGDVTVGGNPLVGLVVFLIFVVINFVVITKGSGRIAEVAARFTLDAMPGKQMAIDADLNQGVIDDAEARRRRGEIQREADFHGAMDGASKFVRGDAVAGVLILFVNILGGLFVGIAQEGMALADAFETYTVLTVGDGLVAQVPALIVSTAAGIVVSRAAGGAPLADELTQQLVRQPRAIAVTGGILAALAVVPGLPFAPFAALAAGSGLLARHLWARERAAQQGKARDVVPRPPVDEEAELRRALQLDDLEIEIGYNLIAMVDPERGGELLARIRAMRRQLATEIGFVIPLIHIRDNLQLDPNEYAVLLRGNRLASARVYPNQWLALRPGQLEPGSEVRGIATTDPAFGLPAVWIQERDRERASLAGYGVVDASTTVATHLGEVIRTHSAELLSRQHVRQLVDDLASRAPKIVEELVPNVVSISVLHHTLRALLLERVSIRDLSSILETLAEFAPTVQNPDMLTDLVRERLGRSVTRPYLEPNGTLRAIALAPELDELLRGGIRRGESGASLALEPAQLDQLMRGIEQAVQRVGRRPDGRGPVLLCSRALRTALSRLIARLDPALALLSYSELPANVRVVAEDVVRLADAH
jgi:flagellar biosynthesis protein FlhA